MPIPDPQTLLLPVLKVLADGAEHQVEEIRDRMKIQFAGGRRWAPVGTAGGDRRWGQTGSSPFSESTKNCSVQGTKHSRTPNAHFSA